MVETLGNLVSLFGDKPVPPAVTQPQAKATSLKGTGFYQKHLPDQLNFIPLC